MTRLMDEFLDSVVYDEAVENWDIAETREDPDDDWVEKALRDAIDVVNKHLLGKHDQATHNPHHTVVAYHGTKAKNVSSILKKGLVHGTYDKWVYASTSKASAKKYGRDKDNEDNKSTRYAVVRLDLPKGAMWNYSTAYDIRRYPKAGLKTAIGSDESIPPKYITSVEIYDRRTDKLIKTVIPKWMKPSKSELTETLYIPVALEDNDEDYGLLDDVELEEKAGTVEGAKKAWLIRRRRQIEDLRSRAVATRDARLLARANAMAQSMARLQQASLVIMHLPTKHDQKEHGRLKAKGLPSIDNRTSMKDSDIRAALKQAGVTKSFVSRVTVVSRREMDVRMDVDAMFSGKPPRKSNTIGYFDVKTKEMVLTPHRNMAALVAHEMGHATAKAYPSMVKNFFSMITSGDTAHYREYSLMEKAVEKRGYPSRQYTSEAFAEFYAVVMSGRGAFGGVRSKFPYALKFFTEGG